MGDREGFAIEKGGADIHEGKGHEERRRATKGLEKAQEGSAKGRQGEKGFPRKGKKISTKGHEERRRATKGLEEAQEGSAKGGEGGKDFQEEAEVSVKGELFATFATGQVILPANVMFCLFQYRVRPGEKFGFTTKSTKVSLLQNSLGSGIYCREELLSLGARASRPHKTWQGRGDWLHRVGRFTRRLTLEQRLDKYAGGTPALPGGNPWLARCRSLSRALFCRSILPPSHARLRILQKAQVTKRIFRNPSRDAGCEDIHAGRRPSAGSDHTKPACLGRFSSFRSFCVFVPFVAIPGKDPAAVFCKRLRMDGISRKGRSCTRG